MFNPNVMKMTSDYVYIWRGELFFNYK